MTTVERYRSTQLEFHSDATSKPRRSYSSPSTIIKNIPPAVPSPPSLSTRDSPPRNPHAEATSSSSLDMTSEESSQWLFTDAEIASTPSVLHGLSPQEERSRRAKGVNFIIQAGILLKLPQLTLATASVFFHRFFMRHSMVQERGGMHHYELAATALFLATKTEENCRKTKEIVIAVAKVAQKNPSLIIDEQSKEYWRWRDNLLIFEEAMLETLTFDVVIPSPYTFLYGFLSDLGLSENKQVRNNAWTFINDSCLTSLCLLMPSKDVAIGAIYFGVKFAGEAIEDSPNGTPWWERLGGNPDRIIKAVGTMADFWRENPMQKPDQPFVTSPSSGEEDLDSTRKLGEPVLHAESPPEERNGQMQSQSLHNDHSQQGLSPTQNGNKNTDQTQIKTAENKGSPGLVAQNGIPSTEEVAPASRPSGSSDAALKIAANDPATHEASGDTNGMSAVVSVPQDPPKPSPKRKAEESDETEQSDSKRVKLDETVSIVDASHSTENGSPGMAMEESEEGELEE